MSDAARPAPPVQRRALFDATGQYRWRLERIWATQGPRVTMVLLNPSQADAQRDDPTLRRCMAFARAWGAARLTVVNLFAFRATRPADLRAAPDPVGAQNDRHLLAAARASQRLVLAWGVHGAWQGRDAAVLRKLHRPGLPPLECLGLTQAGQPRHVLYLRNGTPLRPFGGR